MKLIKEGATRKIDDLGRITLPKNMRKRLNTKSGDELEFFGLEDDDGKYYICLTSQNNPPSYKYNLVTQIFTEYGIEVPKEFLNAVARETFQNTSE